MCKVTAWDLRIRDVCHRKVFVLPWRSVLMQRIINIAFFSMCNTGYVFLLRVINWWGEEGGVPADVFEWSHPRREKE